MDKTFKYGFILNRFLKKYFSKISSSQDDINQLLSILSDQCHPVFLGKDVNFVDYLYLNHLLKSHKQKPIGTVNELLRFFFETPGGIVQNINISRKYPKEKGIAFLMKEHYPSLIFLRKSSLIHFKSREFLENPLLPLLKIQKTLEDPIILIPQALLFEKKPKDFKHAVDREKNGNFLKSAYQIFRHYKKGFASFLDPINLRSFMAQHQEKSLEDIADALWARVIFRLDKEEQITKGPVIRGKKLKFEQIINTPAVQKAITVNAIERKQTPEESKKYAQKILKKMAADYRVGYADPLFNIVTFLLKKLYNDVDVDSVGIQKLKQLSKNYTPILIPCHKSHVDYLVLSETLYRHGLVPPHIAAGDNLMFFPMGPIFRKGGAFFIKRSFRDNPFYATLFKEYLAHLLKDRFSIEFFIEGGRSRTGKLLPPKTGLLSMLLEAFHYGTNKKVAIVPISLSYEKVIEEKSYLKEISGGEKEKENLNNLINSRKLLKSRYGRIHIRFGESIKLDEYFSNTPDPLKTLKQDTDNLAYETLHRINDAFLTTASGLLGTVLMSFTQNPIDFNIILGRFLALYHYINHKKTRCSTALKTPSLALDEAMLFFQQSKQLILIDQDKELFELPPQKRVAVEYYKNNIIHLILPELLILTVMQQEDTLPDIKHAVLTLAMLFQDEFTLQHPEDVLKNIPETINLLLDQGIISQNKESYKLHHSEKGMDPVLFINLLKTYFESYIFTIEYLLALPKNKKHEYKGIIKSLISKGIKQREQLSYFESIHKNKFENCIKTLKRNDVITYQFEGKHRYLVIKNREKIETQKTFLTSYLEVL